MLENLSLRSSHETQSPQTGSCTKVHMNSMAVGRAVDLTKYDNYHDLLCKLEEMFNIEGELTGDMKKWQVVYTDDEIDMMLVGDDPWHMVRKVYIYTYEEAKQLSKAETMVCSALLRSVLVFLCIDLDKLARAKLS